ncbi:MAG: glutamate--tRNA ligase family protein, partial [Planctomycetota bacterium]|nr:glutamate--tRNA ligase family protein [Planctomycetota bacterium]
AEWSGAFVVARTWQQPAYQLAVVVDDAMMGIAVVVRAEDLLLSTHRQLLLYEALELPAPAFLHVPLVVGPDGRRLAKRHGDTRLSALRAAGVPARRVVGWLAMTCGLAQPGEECMPEDLIARFSLDRLPRERPVVSRETLFL